jgi:predicted PurR-regulated permease PerM
MKQLWRSPAVRLGVVVVGVALFLWMLVALHGVVTPFLVGFAIAYILNPPVNALEAGFRRALPRRKGEPILHPRTAAVAVLLVLVTGVLALFFGLAVPAAFHQVGDAISQLPADVASLRTKLEPKLQHLGERYPLQAAEIRARLEAFFSENIGAIVERVTHFIQATLFRILSVALTAFGLLVVPIFAAYLLYDMNHITAGAKDLVPLRYRPYAYSRMEQVDERLSAFVRGQLTIVVMMTIFYGVVLSLFGVPMALLVSVVIGLCHLVPFVCSIVGLPLVAVLALVDSQSFSHAAVVVTVVALGQFVEANVVSPKIVGHGVGLEPVIIVLAVFVGEHLFGIVGMLVAVPLVATLSVFWADLLELYLASDFYRGDPPPPPLPPVG